jgi:hypothetical protein
MWGSIDDLRQWLVRIGVFLAAICAALALHYLLVAILSGLARRSTSRIPDLLIKRLRRLVMPITCFVERPFQNWTRASTDLLGTVLLYVDYAMPVEALRAELQRILGETELGIARSACSRSQTPRIGRWNCASWSARRMPRYPGTCAATSEKSSSSSFRRTTLTPYPGFVPTMPGNPGAEAS